MTDADGSIVTGLRIGGMAHGGDGVARSQGKVVFVAGAIPDDLVEARVVDRRKSFDRAEIERLLEPSPSRVVPPCRHFGECGGCQWQMADYPSQLAWKHQIVVSQLAHLGGIDTEVRPVASVGPAFGYRNRMDFRLADGRPALTRGRTHQPVRIADCLLLVEPLRRIVAGSSRWEGRRLTVRAGVATGEVAVMVDDAEAVVHEVVGGVRFRISGRAFFQVNTGGAEALVEAVSDILRPTRDDRMLDGYAGGGLFTATVGRGAGAVMAIESSRPAVADLRHNAPHAEAIEQPMERALNRLGRVDLAVVDPPREGLGPAVVEGLAAARPRVIASVSCDPATFARDARMLGDAGYRLTEVRPFDLFPQTYHVEVVGRFER